MHCEFFVPFGKDDISFENLCFSHPSDSWILYVCFITRCVIAARAGKADTWHHRVLLQAAGGGGSSSAAHSPLHRRNVCQGADGGSKTVSTAEGVVKKIWISTRIPISVSSRKLHDSALTFSEEPKKVTCSWISALTYSMHKAQKHYYLNTDSTTLLHFKKPKCHVMLWTNFLSNSVLVKAASIWWLLHLEDWWTCCRRRWWVWTSVATWLWMKLTGW